MSIGTPVTCLGFLNYRTILVLCGKCQSNLSASYEYASPCANLSLINELYKILIQSPPKESIHLDKGRVFKIQGTQINSMRCAILRKKSI